MPRRYKTPQEALENRTIPEPNSGCLIWLGSVHRKGYGHIGVNGKTEKTHRFAWEQTNGPIPDGMHVLHYCDNPSCVNPDHLFIGTNADNVADKIKKGRDVYANGEDHGASKLSKSDVIAIRSDARPRKEIAANYGVSISQIGRILRREHWVY
ncbi:MAG: HNH endonuclease [Colwellia sp.]|nr:HNH endonuclease [Colwellia sp.]